MGAPSNVGVTAEKDSRVYKLEHQDLDDIMHDGRAEPVQA